MRSAAEATASLVISTCDGCLMPAAFCPASKTSDLAWQLVGYAVSKATGSLACASPCVPILAALRTDLNSCCLLNSISTFIDFCRPSQLPVPGMSSSCFLIGFPKPTLCSAMALARRHLSPDEISMDSEIFYWQLVVGCLWQKQMLMLQTSRLRWRFERLESSCRIFWIEAVCLGFSASILSSCASCPLWGPQATSSWYLNLTPKYLGVALTAGQKSDAKVMYMQSVKLS